MPNLRLSDDDHQALQQILQIEDVPDDPETEEFTQAVNTVMEHDPELAQRYILAVPIPSPTSSPDLQTDKEARSAQNRKRVMDLRRLLFMRDVDGDWVPAQRKIWTVALAVMTVAILIAGVAVINDMGKVEAEAIPEPVLEEVVEEEPLEEPALALPEPEPAPTPSLSIDNFPNLAPPPVATPGIPSPARTNAPTPGPALALPPAVPPAPVASPSAGAPGTLDYNPHDPNEEVLPLTVATAPAPAFDPLTAPPIGLFRQSTQPVTGAPGTTMNRPITAFRDAPAVGEETPSNATVYAATAQGPAEVGSLSVFQPSAVPAPSALTVAGTPTTSVSTPEAAATSTVFARERMSVPTVNSMTVASTTPVGLPAASGAGDAAAASGLTVLFDRSSEAGAPATANAEASDAEAADALASTSSPMLREGARIPARLVTSATVLDGQPGPVLVESTCGAREAACNPTLFLGQVQLLAGDRLVINFDRAVVGGAVQPITAMALAADLSTNIPATVMDQAPTVAQDMFRSALTGVGRYVDALAGRTRTTVVGDNIISESIPPQLQDFVMGSVAGSFGFEGDRLSFVRVAEVASDTPVVVLVGTSY